MKYAQSLRFILLGVTEMCKLENNNIKKKGMATLKKIISMQNVDAINEKVRCVTIKRGTTTQLLSCFKFSKTNDPV
jgi:hypothetical protein